MFHFVRLAGERKSCAICASYFCTTPYLLHEGDNVLSILAIDDFGRSASASVIVYVDRSAPWLSIESPAADTITSNASVDMRGIVNDAIAGGVGAVEPVVTITNAANQQTVSAAVADFSFLGMGVPLEVGSNLLTVTATDNHGNTGRETRNVVRIAAGSRRITLLGGNRQTGAAQAELPQALAVVAMAADGLPIAGLPVHFDVVRGNGSISTTPGTAELGDGVNPARNLVVISDGAGQAQVFMRLGSQSGPGGNSLRVWTPGIAEDVVFSASVIAGAPFFVFAEGLASTQYAAAGSAPLEALSATVYDQNSNRVSAARVRYSVFDGPARFTAQSALAGELAADGQSLIVRSDRHGVASARPLLGELAPGADSVTVKILAEALKDDGQPTGQAMFQLMVLAPRPGPTRFSGVIMDHSGAPLAGVTASIAGTPLLTVSDDAGRFRFDEQVPAGRIELLIDGRTAPTAVGRHYPALHFAGVVVAGQDNQLPRPIYLPPVHDDRAQIVGGAEDVHLTVPGFEGFEMIVKAHSVTFPDGSHVGPLTVNPVHNDRLPMVPPGGGSRFGSIAWTLQPAGTRFDPPIEVRIPNPGQMRPGQTASLVQWDHDLATFVPIGRATVSEDASQVITDPGSGITKAGWGGCTGPACPPDPGYPQCAIGAPSQCRGAQCSMCNFCQKESGGGATSCPVCVNKTEQEIEFEITNPPAAGATTVDVSTESEDADTVVMTLASDVVGNTVRQWSYESQVETHVRDARPEDDITALDLNCSSSFDPDLLVSTELTTAVTLPDVQMATTGSATALTRDLITDPAASLKLELWAQSDSVW